MNNVSILVHAQEYHQGWLFLLIYGLLRATHTSASVIEVLSQEIGGIGREVESGGGMYRLKELIKQVGFVMNVC